MEIAQSIKLTPTVKLSRHGKHKNPNYQREYYLKNRQKILVLRKINHQKTYQSKVKKSRSFFVKNREKKFINCLDKHHITVPIPRQLKTKHPHHLRLK